MKIHYITNPSEHNEKVTKYNEDIGWFRQYSPEEADVIVSGGGDGTLLKCIKEYRHLNKPFWGYNAGTIGFLMNTHFPNAYKKEKIITKTFNLIKVNVTYSNTVPDGKSGNIYTKEIKVHRTYQAFNDIAIGGDMNFWGTFNIQEKDNFFGKVKGGGIIISTPQGSTAINKNNNGSVLSLDSNLWSVTGDKTERKIKAVIEPRKVIINVDSRTPVTLWIDGANTIVKNVSMIEISKGDEVQVMFGDYSEFQKKRRL